MQTLTSKLSRSQALSFTLQAVIVLCFCRSAVAEVAIQNVEVGQASLSRVGRFTQVLVEVESDQTINDVRLELRLPDSEGVQSVFVREGISLKSGSNSIREVAKFGRVRSELHVRLLSNSEVLAERTMTAKALLASQNLVLTLGPDVAVGDAISLRHEKKEQETIHALVKDAAKLPEHWLGYDGVSLVVLPSGSRGLVDRMSAPQLAALDQWVRLGGRLILSSGAGSEQKLANDGPLARFLPGAFDRVTMQRQTNGIENYVGNTKQSLSSFVAEGDLSFKIPMAVLQQPRGTAIVSEGIGRERTPFVLRASHGFGHVIFVAVDLDDAPFSQWQDGRRRLMGKLLDISLGVMQRDDGDKKFSSLTQIGFDDLTGQLRAGLDQFSAVKLVPFSWIALLIAAYVLLIGPADYFLLRRLKQRFSWTWFTFPLVVLAASALAFSLTKSWKGRSLHVNQVDIVDLDARSGLSRTMTWAHIFSPASRKYDIAAKPTERLFKANSPSGEIASWQGLPGNSFGGMNTNRLSQSNVSYEVSSSLGDVQRQEVRLRQLPIDVYSSRSLSGLVWSQVEIPEMPELVSKYEDQIDGEVKNPLPVDLKDSVLCFGRLAYPLGTLPAGGGTIVDRFGAKKMSSRLTRWKVDLDHKGVSTLWDRKGLDLARIMEIMMFHDAAGGPKYTSLLNRYQGEVDFSDHLEEGTAVLIGRVESRPVELITDSGGQNDSGSNVTYVRILMPVTKITKDNKGT